MTVKEMHIEIQQATQNVGSNKRRKLLPEEMDWVLNKVQARYIHTHATSIRNAPSAEHSITHLNRIQSLARHTDLPVYKGEENEVYGQLPVTVYELLSVQPEVQLLCGTRAETLRGSHLLHLLRIPQAAAGTPPYYSTARITIDGTKIFDAADIAAAHNGAYTGFSRPYLWPLLRIMLPELPDNVYWEWYNGEYFPNTLIFDGLPASQIILTLGASTYTAVASVRVRTEYVLKMPKRKPGRLYFQTVLPDIEAGAYTRTDGQSPLCVLEQSRLSVRTDESFIVGGCRLHYIRRPRGINVDLGIDCELPEVAHQDICDLATEYIKGLREDPNWELKLQENMNRTTI